MKILVLLLFPFVVNSQTLTDSTIIPLPGGSVIRYATTYGSVSFNVIDSILFKGTTSKRRGVVSPLDLPIATATQTALNLKTNTASPLFINGFGYTTGAGGTITQATSKATAVTLNKITGRITMMNSALAAGAEVAFTLTNSTIAATDVIIVNVQSVGTAGSYLVSVGAVANGSCSITVSNASAASLSQAVVLNFAVIKSVIN